MLCNGIAWGLWHCMGAVARLDSIPAEIRALDFTGVCCTMAYLKCAGLLVPQHLLNPMQWLLCV